VQLPDQKPSECLGPTAQVAGRNVPADVSGYLGPPVVLGDELQRLEVASMTSDPGIVVLLQNLAAQILVPRDNILATEVQESGLDVPLGRLGGSGTSDLEDLARCQRDGLLNVRVRCEGIPNVSEEGDLRSDNNNAFERTDME
jgi:hypothetical protein